MTAAPEPSDAGRRRRPGADSAWLRAFSNLAAGEAVASLMRLAGFLWTARQLGPSLFGTVSAALVVGAYLAVLAHSGLGISGTQRVAAGPETAQHNLGEIVGLRLALAVVVYGLTLAVTGAMSLESETRAIVLVYALLVFTQAADVRWAFVGIQKTRAVAVASVIAAAGYFAGVLLLVHGPDDVLRVPELYLASELLLAVILTVVSRRRFGSWRSRLPRAPAARATWIESLPITLMLGARTGVISLDVVLVRLLRPSVQAGQYAVASRFTLSAIVYLGLYYYSFLPSLVRACTEGPTELRRLVRLAVRRAAVVGVPLGLAATLAIPYATREFFGAHYQPTAGLLQALVWGLVLLGFAGIYANVLLAAHQERRLAVVTVGSLAVNVAANLILLPRVGTIGAPIATIIAEGAFLVGCWASTRPLLDPARSAEPSR